MRVLVVGATGTQGRRMAAELARSDAVDGLLLAARDATELDRVAAMLGRRDDIRTTTVDARDQDQIATAAADVDVIVSCAGPAYETEHACVAAAIEARTPCATLGDDYEVATEVGAAHGASARSEAVTVVIGCGLSPGITNVLAAFAHREIDEPDEIEIAVACSIRDNLGVALVSDLLRTFSEDAVYVSEWQALSGRAGDLPELAFLPEPVGWVETFNCSHPEVDALSRQWRELRRLRYRFGFTERAAMDAIRGAAASGLARSESARRACARFLKSLQTAIGSLPPRAAPWSGARVDVRGKVDGRHTTVSLGVVDHLTNLTSAMLVFSALELGSRRVESPGVWSVGELLDVDRVLAGLYGRGVRVARLTPGLFDGAAKTSVRG
jgi:saccharopine dehydrogenase-like NADP-dependent oxidoreductase